MSQGTAYPVPFGAETLYLYELDGYPYVPIEPICAGIGVPSKRHAQRVCAQAAHAGLRLVWTEAERWHAISLEDLSWFLRTCRPQDDDVRAKLQMYRDGLVWCMFWHWFYLSANYSPLRDYAPRISAALPPIRQMRRGGARVRLSLEDAALMRALRAQGLSMSEIGQRLRCSASAVCQILHGKYPIVLKPRDSVAGHSRETVIKRPAHDDAVGAARVVAGTPLQGDSDACSVPSPEHA